MADEEMGESRIELTRLLDEDNGIKPR